MPTKESITIVPYTLSTHGLIPKNYTGQRFGRLVCVKPVYKILASGKKRGAWECLCDCSNITYVETRVLKTTVSCGCYKTDIIKQRLTTHGQSKKRSYRIWTLMMNRCFNPKNASWRYYGGRGITVCDRWQSYENFAEDMEEPPSKQHSIDRKNSDGNYGPDNCQWATPMEQVRGRRNTAMITIDGVSRPLIEWCKIAGTKYVTAFGRLRKGWPPKEAIFTPANQRFADKKWSL